MKQASALPDRYRIGRTQFYQRRDYLIKLGYNMEPVKQGRNSFYSDEQIHWLDELNTHIKKHSTLEGFPAAVIEVNNVCVKADMNLEISDPRSELVHAADQTVRIESTKPEEILVDTTPLEDIQEQNLRSVDEAAQYIAAQNLTALNYLTVGYMKERTFTVPGLAEQVNQSEQVVRQSFTSLMESPEAIAKKLMSRVKPKAK
jgi:spore germination protein GerM